jgi:hypothetical protein
VRNALCPPPPFQGPQLPYFQGVLQALQQAVCNAQCPHPWGHAPEPECPKPSPLLKELHLAVTNNLYPVWQSYTISNHRLGCDVA